MQQRPHKACTHGDLQMKLPSSSRDVAVSLESVLCTDELNRRPSRSPDYQAESRALAELGAALADSPRTILQKLVEVTLRICRAGSAGVSLLSKEDDGKTFYWPAVAGAWSPHVGGGTPRDFGPCGVVLDRNAMQLFTHPERYYPYLLPIAPPIEEALLIPFYVKGRAVGTVWVIAHDRRRKFDAEDLRLIISLGKFAAGAYQVLESLDALGHRGEALRASEKRFRSLVVATSLDIWTAEPDGQVVKDSVSWRGFTGQTFDEWKGWGWLDAIHPEDRERTATLWRQCVANEHPFQTEYRLRATDGSYRWTAVRAVPVPGSDGRVREWIGTNTDITERKQAEATSAFLAAVVQNSDDAIITKNLDGVITSWNRSAERLFGYREQEVLGRPVTILIPPDRLDEEPQILDRLRRGERVDHFETIRLRKDGGALDVSLTISPVKDAAGRIVGVSKTARDITDRKRAAALLQHQKEALEMVARQVPLFDVLDFLARAVESQSQEQMMAAIHLLNAAGTHFALAAAPSLPAAYLQATEGLAVDSRSGPCCEAVLLGKLVTVPDVAHDPRFPRFAELALPCGIRAGWSTPIFSSRGKAVGTFANYYREPRKPSPQDQQLLEIVTHTVALAIEHKQAEEELREADRRKTEFLAMLAHELRNPLAPTRNAVQILRRTGSDDPAVQSASEMLQRQVGHMVRLVDDLLDVSRISQGKIELRKEQIELTSVVNHAVEAVRPLCESRNLELTVTLPPQPIYLNADPTRLAQVVGNLLDNACKFTERGGRIQLTSSATASRPSSECRTAASALPRINFLASSRRSPRSIRRWNVRATVWASD
jgi:PAS domain S-box-containing protein